MFAENLRAARERKGWTPAALARESGIHRVTLHHLEAGTRLPRMATLDRLADALGVTKAHLLRAEPPRRRRSA